MRAQRRPGARLSLRVVAEDGGGGTVPAAPPRFAASLRVVADDDDGGAVPLAPAGFLAMSLPVVAEGGGDGPVPAAPPRFCASLPVAGEDGVGGDCAMGTDVVVRVWSIGRSRTISSAAATIATATIAAEATTTMGERLERPA